MVYLPLCLLLKDNTRKLWKECYKCDKFSLRKVDVQQSSIFEIAFICCFCRKFAFCICCILCIYYSFLHPLSSRSGVQKVCKNVQSQNQPLKTGIGFLCKAGKTVRFEPETAAEILPVQTTHQMYIHNYNSWQGA